MSGYERDKFRLWVDADGDGCDTREEVLIAEAVDPPTMGASCALPGGSSYSYYDAATWTDKADIDIDHFVPLAEAWDSGASGWTATQREEFANDLGDDRDLVGVTDSVNQSKSDQEPGRMDADPRDVPLCRRVGRGEDPLQARSRHGREVSTAVALIVLREQDHHHRAGYVADNPPAHGPLSGT